VLRALMTCGSPTRVSESEDVRDRQLHKTFDSARRHKQTFVSGRISSIEDSPASIPIASIASKTR
jgi:hypothetical protein